MTYILVRRVVYVAVLVAGCVSLAGYTSVWVAGLCLGFCVGDMLGRGAQLEWCTHTVNRYGR